MSFLAKKLKRRIQILEAVETENEFGGFTRNYNKIITIWCQVKSISEYVKAVSAVRGSNINERGTHEFMVRMSAVNILGKGFESGFGAGFNVIADSNPVKSDYYLMLEQGSGVKGRLFRVKATRQDEVNKEFLKITAEMIEEKGTGYPEINPEYY